MISMVSHPVLSVTQAKKPRQSGFIVMAIDLEVIDIRGGFPPGALHPVNAATGDTLA
jgi:hypothetical protein